MQWWMMVGVMVLALSAPQPSFADYVCQRVPDPADSYTYDEGGFGHSGYTHVAWGPGSAVWGETWVSAMLWTFSLSSDARNRTTHIWQWIPEGEEQPYEKTVNFSGTCDAWAHVFLAGYQPYTGAAHGNGNGNVTLPTNVQGSIVADAGGSGNAFEDDDNPAPQTFQSEVKFTSDWSGETWAAASTSGSATVAGRADATSSASSG